MMIYITNVFLLIAMAMASAFAVELPDKTLRDSNDLVALVKSNGMNGFIEGVVGYERFLTANKKLDIQRIENVFGDESAYLKTLGGICDPYVKYIGAVNVSDIIIHQVYSIQFKNGQLLVALTWYKGDNGYWICKFLFGDNAEPYALRLANITK